MTAATYGLIEAGGTKFVLGIADAAGRIIARQRIPTTAPETTLGEAIAWFAAQAQVLPLRAIGIASFGPLDLDHKSASYGQVLATPKPGWTGTALIAPFAEAFACPVVLDTDVNGAALAEMRWGAGQGVDEGRGALLYLTIGTGIGGGFASDGRLLHGRTHPEMGHIRMPHHPQDLGFAGVCPFHGDCLEGLASGPAVIARWGASLSALGPDHPGQQIVAWYLGRAIATFQAVMAPATIVLGGGLMGTPGLIERIRVEAANAGAGYFPGNPADMITAPGLGTDSGLLGALALIRAAEGGVPNPKFVPS